MLQDTVSVPGMGCFIVKTMPSQLLNDGKTITPPSKILVFESSNNSTPDNLLASIYSKMSGVSQSKAAAELAELLRILKKELIDNAIVEFPDFGAIKYGESGNFIFESSDSFDIAACYYSLEPLMVMPKIVNNGASEVADQNVEEKAEKEVTKNVDNKEKEVVEKEKKKEEEKVVMEKEKKKEEEKKVEEKKVVMEDVKRLSGYRKMIIAVCIVLVVIVVAIVVLVIFKDDFMPLWENLLYSEEELEFLRNVGR